MQMQVGVATVFSANDEFNPDPYCPCLKRNLNDRTDYIVAHRTLPCRTPLVVCLPRSARCVRVVIGDRGPYGRKANKQFRATLDLAPAVKKVLKHNGYEKVLWVKVP